MHFSKNLPNAEHMRPVAEPKMTDVTMRHESAAQAHLPYVPLTLQRGVTSTARHSVNITCRGVTSPARHDARSHSFVYISTS